MAAKSRFPSALGGNCCARYTLLFSFGELKGKIKGGTDILTNLDFIVALN